MIITYMYSEESEVVSRAANLLTDDAKPASQFGMSPARAEWQVFPFPLSGGGTSM